MKLTMRTIVFLLAALSAEAISAASYEATVMFGRRVELGLPVSGVVKTANVMTGQNVAAGQILIALDDTLFVAAVKQAEAGLARCSAANCGHTRLRTGAAIVRAYGAVQR